MEVNYTENAIFGVRVMASRHFGLRILDRKQWWSPRFSIQNPQSKIHTAWQQIEKSENADGDILRF
jgi:hypothetical protein